jgi:hypothetical protein
VGAQRVTFNSPFNWRAKPSILAADHDINGVNARKSIQATNLKKTPFVVGLHDPRTPCNQVNAYGRAKVSNANKDFKE